MDLIHTAIDYQWRNGANPADFNGGTVLPAGAPPNAVTTSTELFRFRARQSIRDAIGAQTGDAGFDLRRPSAIRSGKIEPSCGLAIGTWVRVYR